MLMVLLSLSWWAGVLTSPNENTSWRSAVNDVAWVLSQLAQVDIKGKKRVIDDGAASKRPAKKRK